MVSKLGSGEARRVHFANAVAHATIAVLLGSSGVVACSSTTGSSGNTSDGGAPTAPPANCGKAGRSGKTECRGLTCSAGQYCVQGNAVATRCDRGCTSDENCGEAERCVRCGNDATGTCQSCTRSDADSCQTGDGCTRVTPEDRECASGGKAFECLEDKEPGADRGQCTQTKVPLLWCCGAGVASSCKRNTLYDQSECGHPGPSGPRPPKAYSCGPDEQPSDPKCVHGDLPSIWCCPS